MHLLLGILLLGAVSVDEFTLDQVLAAHQRYLDQIHSIEAEIETWASDDNGETWELKSRDHWWRDGTDERGTRWSASYFDEKVQQQIGERFQDQSFANGVAVSLFDWNPRAKREGQPSPANHYFGAHGGIQRSVAQTATSIGGPVLLLLRGAMIDSLQNAVATADTSVVVHEESDGRVVWGVQAIAKKPMTYILRYTMDPAKGFAPVEQRIGIGSTTSFNQDSKVVEYQKASGDIWIPSRIRRQLSSSAGSMTEYRLTSLKLNQPIDRSMLQVTIPEGMLVQEGSQFHIWGKDGPRLTFGSEQALKEYEASFFPTRSRPWPLKTIGLSVGAVAALALVVWQWRIRATARAKSG